MSQAIVVAGLWARPLAESAQQAGWRAIALDLYGDADTRRAAVAWHRIGDPAPQAIEPALLREALHAAARERDAIGWVAGSGFEGAPGLLDEVVPGLPLLAMPGAAVRRLRDPASFFGGLDHAGLHHPEVTLHVPGDPGGWLCKSAGGAGGWHIRAAGEPAPAHAGDYWQRMETGTPMSALFLADGRRARLVALNHLLVEPLGARPFVFAGVVGPVHDDGLRERMEDALARLVPAFELRGLASLDILAQEDRMSVLEINPRPSASMVLHPHAWPGGLLQAHVAAVRGSLPAEAPRHPEGVRGHRIVFARRSCQVPPALAAALARSADCHDLPAPGSFFGEGEPVCSVTAAAADVPGVLAALAKRAGEVQAGLLPCREGAA